MSSHHFVKEQQEPAVFILNADEVHFDQISPLLEWVPTVLVAEQALDQVLSWGIKIDVILASESFQAENMNLLLEQYPVKFLRADQEKSLDEGLNYLMASSHFAAHLVGFPHLRALELLDKTKLMDLTILDGEWKYYPIKDGHFKKWFPESTIHIHAKEGLPVEIVNENGQMILPISYATFMEVPEGPTEIKAPSSFWIGEKIR
ncbi:thiamine pyrophosphokinase [Algoriphagus aestuarii]|nr:thiamine pyrophosphokinase [Algoriphagus aestuarii]